MAGYAFLAWVPQADDPSPFKISSVANKGHNETATTTTAPSMHAAHLAFNQSSTLMLAVMPSIIANSRGQLPGTCDELSYINYGAFEKQALGDATFLKCEVFNTSMSAAFEHFNGDQTVTVIRHHQPDDETLVPLKFVTGPFGPLFQLGEKEMSNRSCSTLNVSGGRCKLGPEVMRVLSYQAMLVNRLVQGTIGLNTNRFSPGIESKSNVLDTVLQDTNELAFFQDNTKFFNTTTPTLTNLIQESTGREYTGLYNNATVLNHLPLATALEQLFQNITISLLSHKLLQPDPASSYAPPALADVTTTRTHNIYVYADRTLWLAYGIAISFAFLSVAAGTVAVALNGASYNSKFSTIVRVGRVADLTAEVTESDGDGKEPLPKHLAAARLSMKRSWDESQTPSELVGMDKAIQSVQSTLLPLGSAETEPQ